MAAEACAGRALVMQQREDRRFGMYVGMYAGDRGERSLGAARPQTCLREPALAPRMGGTRSDPLLIW